MKKTFLILLCLSLSHLLSAQDAVKQKEIGFGFYDLNSFGLTFKIGNEKSLWRFNTMFITGSNEEEDEATRKKNMNSIDIGVRVGKEYRKHITEKLDMRYGIDLALGYLRRNYDYTKTRQDETGSSEVYSEQHSKETRYKTGMNFVFGFNYSIGDNLLIGVELLPGVEYYTSEKEVREERFAGGSPALEENTFDASGFDYGFRSTSTYLTLAYKF